LDIEQGSLECYRHADGAFELSATGHGDARMDIIEFSGMAIDLGAIRR
jgi:hypothetical protein